MRILHFADLHLGVENYGTFDLSSGLSTRVHDFLRAFDRIVDRATQEDVDAILFAGDAFKNRDPSPTIQREFAKRILRVSRAGIPIVLLVGNHDLPNAWTRAVPTEIYQTLELPGVYVCRQVELIPIPTKSGVLQVVTLPWVTRSMFLGSEEFRIKADADLDLAIAEQISMLIAKQTAELDPALPAVLVAHLSLQGATLGFEQSIMLGKDVTVGRDELHAGSFDYIALGHIHKHQQVESMIPPAVYAGSPERIDFGEEREKKGFVLATIETLADGSRTTSWQFEVLSTRPFKTLRIEASGDEPMEVVAREIRLAAPDLVGAIVRVFVKVDPGRERNVPAGDVRRQLLEAGAQFVGGISVESEEIRRRRWEIDDQSGRDSLSMLERWVEMKEYDDKLRERVMARGKQLIELRRSRLDGGTNEHG